MSKNTYTVQTQSTLMPFLIETFKDKSRTTIKSYLANRQIEVNGRIIKQFDHPLNPGDEVDLCLERRTEELRHPMLNLVYEDDAIIVIDKASGLLSMGTDREREKTAFFILSQHVKKADTQNRIFILHRLDRDTSGLMMFAKSEEIKRKMQADWDNMVLERKYVAVAEGVLARPEGVISTFLTETKGFKVFVSNKNEGERAITSYRVLKSNPSFSLLELELSTGKKNQIRAHLEYIGHPIVGDKKYGAKSNPLARVALHAVSLRFVHPTTDKEMSFTTPIPGKFNSLFKK